MKVPGLEKDMGVGLGPAAPLRECPICCRVSREGPALHKPLRHGRVEAALAVPATTVLALGTSLGYWLPHPKRGWSQCR